LFLHLTPSCSLLDSLTHSLFHNSFWPLICPSQCKIIFLSSQNSQLPTQQTNHSCPPFYPNPVRVPTRMWSFQSLHSRQTRQFLSSTCFRVASYTLSSLWYGTEGISFLWPLHFHPKTNESV